MKKNFYIRSRDLIPSYVPKKPRFVVLGTMAAINARYIDGLEEPIQPYFFYNNNRNRFWKYMWSVFENKNLPMNLTVPQKKEFCEKWGMAITNILGEMKTKNNDAKNRTDTIIYEAHKNNRVQVRDLDKDFKKCISTLPIFFTCYSKEPLKKLLQTFFKHNSVDTQYIEKINYLHTPAMPGRGNVLEMWKESFKVVL